MKRIFIKDLAVNGEETVLLKGWVHKIRDLSHVSFILLRDKSGIIQLVCTKEQIKGLRLENAVEVTGIVRENEKAPKGMEIEVSDIKIAGTVYYDKLPFEIQSFKEKAALETQLDYRTISLRIPKKKAIFKVQNEIEEAFRMFFKGNDFEEIHTPKITHSGTEGGSEMFTVNYFNRRAFLAQSPQFWKQMMVGAGFERVFEVGYAYRAELHNTWRHLNEYVSLDVEMGFIKDETDLMEMEESFIRYLYKHLNEKCAEELKLFDVVLPEEINIPRIPLAKAQEILLTEFNKKSPVGNIDNEGEALFHKYVKEKYNSDYVFLTEYPTAKRPMYAMECEENREMTKSFDLIFKGVEITTGGQRIHDYEMLKAKMERLGLKLEDFAFYLDTFKYGMPPHGGFAIGLERITMQILNLGNIREASLFPRDMKRLTP
ncbi:MULTISPECIES: aspartate--tRNA(Asn) ligase [Clostridium]|jgi:aspartyl-tRNA synthetase, archaeal type|uniref:Aspartate--tRNA(Asp/Asn) ligase n=1 Tax=Clostridium beijerinckii TaxID=1520 RepID=A0A0B5QGI8_CLOBE|nr:MULTISPECIES: aspartate--tRNA(Asn) ligase [Clostridium]AJH00071.1 aspartate--tRNA(Asp/Asn) ligase [Clostridium beijerinckii]AQS04868.1 asparagine--tRNA ligase [Clostridium beijerinckii]MBA2888040.1 nondiscriminating aspartyl-tRNA synthetase [Clostridium beijerinckii]MBA2902756.1 nondiscriminating aspartyl-tRNA synthetase [Clostridium beijerinckii]MBA2912598.1 nondiscriminating aspartyl-tRNA synthetase [Clostridium beijerinckii]